MLMLYREELYNEDCEEPLLDGAGVPEHVRDPVGEQLLDDREPARLARHVRVG